MTADRTISRRLFIQAAAAVPLAAGSAAAWARVLGSNDRLHLAVIGTGGMGQAHLRGLTGRAGGDNVEVIRVCDVYRRRLDAAAGIAVISPGSAGTMEYREVLDDRDVDAVIIATPDHWHTKIAIEAMDAGKDVYVEKPLSLTVEQAIACRDAVKRTRRTLQVGPQGTSEDQVFKARSAIRDGRIGKVVWSQGSYCRNSRGFQFNWGIDADAGPDQPREAAGYVWWDRWLGHEWGLAEQIPWNPDHFFRFRKYWAYNGGVATDLLYHQLAPLLSAISGPDGEYPRRVSAAGGLYIEKDQRDIPDTFFLTVDYPSEHPIVLASVMVNDSGLPTVIRGQRGTMSWQGDTLEFAEQAEWWKEFRAANEGWFASHVTRDDQGTETPDPAPGQARFAIHTAPRRDHVGNFLDAIRGGAALNCNVDLGCSTMVAIKMGVEAYRSGRSLTWDAATEKVSG